MCVLFVVERLGGVMTRRSWTLGRGGAGALLENRAQSLSVAKVEGVGRVHVEK